MGELNIDIGLNAKVKDFAERFGITIDDGNYNDVFEDFGNYTVASNLLCEEVENIESLSTNKSKGIDGIIIIVNDNHIKDENDFEKIGKSEKIKLKIGFIQSTTDRNFDAKKFSAFVDTVVDFLTHSIQIQPFSSIYEKLFDEESDYVDSFEETPIVSLHYLSGVSDHKPDIDSIKNEQSKITNRKDIIHKINLSDIQILTKEDIKNEYDNIAKFHLSTVVLKSNCILDEVENIQFSILSTITVKELKTIILTKDSKLRENVFVENIRSFIGQTSVNKDIKNTLEKDDQRKYFHYLNNGITIMCDKIERHTVKQDTFHLTHPRIINGCQTTHILFEKIINNSVNIDDTSIVAKIISTMNSDLKKKIIIATNNQNAIDSDLQALNSVHEKIESFFLGYPSPNPKLYFERLRGQYSHIHPPYVRITIEILARVYISVFMKEPHKMKTKAISKIHEYQKSKRIFNEISDLEAVYYFCGMLYYYLKYFTLNNKILLKSKTADMHLLMAVNLLLDKNFKSINEKIKYISNPDNAIKIFIEANSILGNQAELYKTRGLYSSPKTQIFIRHLHSLEKVGSINAINN